MKTIKTYSELITIPTFTERYKYLRLRGQVGRETFGSERYLNQSFYTSKRWRETRRHVIMRDEGLDLAMPGYDIGGKIIVHHIRPVTIEDIYEAEDWIFDPEFLVCVSDRTHNAIHYGDESLLPELPIERRPNDTCPWR